MLRCYPPTFHVFEQMNRSVIAECCYWKITQLKVSIRSSSVIHRTFRRFFRVGASHSDLHHDVIRESQDYHSGYDIYRFAFFLLIFFFSLIFLLSLSIFSSLSLFSTVSPFSTPPSFSSIFLSSLLRHISASLLNDNDSDHWFS